MLVDFCQIGVVFDIYFFWPVCLIDQVPACPMHCFPRLKAGAVLHRSATTSVRLSPAGVYTSISYEEKWSLAALQTKLKAANAGWVWLEGDAAPLLKQAAVTLKHRSSD